MFEKLLGTLAGESDDTRVELVQIAEPGTQPTIEVRMLRDAGELGWIVHRRIRIGAGQVGELRQALNMLDHDALEETQPRVSHLRLVEFDEAL